MKWKQGALPQSSPFLFFTLLCGRSAEASLTIVVSINTLNDVNGFFIANLHLSVKL